MKNKKLLIICIMALMALTMSISSVLACAPAPAGKKTLKIGLLDWLGYPIGLDSKKGVELLAEMTNNKGGLVIGKDTYNVQVITYDTKYNDETARAAIERLISEDKVQFILGDETVDSWYPTTERNKILQISDTPTTTSLDPNNKYSFEGMLTLTETPELWAWFAKNYPNIKTIVSAMPDSMAGHIYGDWFLKLGEMFGPKVIDVEYYPPTATDLSVVGTKVKSLNPDAFTATVGGPVMDSLCFKAAWQAGWKGQQFGDTTVPAGVMTQLVPPEAVEGMVLGAWDVEKDPAPPVAKEFKDAYIAKYGKWDYPEVLGVNRWFILITALQEAKSLDPDKVAAVISNGMKYESVCCANSVMVSRPELGNTKTVDTMGGIAIKQMVGGVGKIIYTIPIDEAYQYNAKFYGWK